MIQSSPRRIRAPLLLALAAMFAASTIAIFQTDLKRLFAYSSVGQVGYIILGLSFDSTAGLTATIAGAGRMVWVDDPAVGDRLAVVPALNEQSWSRAAINGAVFGFVAYATYDLTNQATLKTWSTTITLADLAWGTIVTTAAAQSNFCRACAAACAQLDIRLGLLNAFPHPVGIADVADPAVAVAVQ